mgnify:CR=1 FL=1
MKNNIFITLFLFLVSSINAQELRYEDYSWEEDPGLTETSLDTSNAAALLKVKRCIEYAYEKDHLYIYILMHKKIKLLSDKGIEEFNKAYIPITLAEDILFERARVINSKGEVKELRDEDIKEGTYEETDQKYRYFAFEGIDVGSEIEYMYMMKSYAFIYYPGYKYIIQSEYPRYNYDFELLTPPNLVFKMKSYNGCPEFERDTVIEEKNRWFISLDTIPRLKSEEHAAYSANLMYSVVKLDKNYATGKRDIFSYGSFASSRYDKIYNLEDKKDQKAIKKIIKKIDIDESSEEAKIRSIENHIKTNYMYKDSYFEGLSSPAWIMENKVFNRLGALRLFAHIFKQSGIEHEIVITCDRFKNKFDKDFEAYHFLEDYLFYFPSVDKYTNPATNFERLGYPDPSLMHNHGLFIQTISMGDYETGIGKIKYIDELPFDKSTEDLYVKANLTSEFGEAEYKIRREMNGYYAYYYQPYFDFIDEEDELEEFKESLIDFIDNEGEIDSLHIENGEANKFGVAPLIATATLKSGHFFEKAGPKYIFKMGELIGPQMELYQKKEEERKLPVEEDFTRKYYRKIIFNIPEGYIAENLDAININETYTEEGDTIMAFISRYRKTGDTITVIVDEYYKKLELPPEQFEDYRRVVNAAANFNKVVVFFEEE